MNSLVFRKSIMTDSFIDLRTSKEDSGSHRHEFFEIAYVISGSCEHTIDGHTTIISRGDYFFVNLKSVHSYAGLSPDFEIINCLFVPEFIDRTLEGAHSFSEIMNNYPARFEYSSFSDSVAGRVFRDGDGFIFTLLSKMLEEFSEKKKGRLDVMRSLLVTLLICFARGEEETAEEESRINAIKEYIAENYKNEPTLSEISKKLGISLTYASLIFKRATAKSFRDYLIKFRIEKACDLLRTTDKTVAEISELVGYSDPAFFYKSFKKHLTLSPSEYRIKRK